MKTLYIATDKSLIIAGLRNGEWAVDRQLNGKDTQCLAIDPQHPEEVYCGTFGQGLWRSNDAGKRLETALCAKAMVSSRAIMVEKSVQRQQCTAVAITLPGNRCKPVCPEKRDY